MLRTRFSLVLAAVSLVTGFFCNRAVALEFSKKDFLQTYIENAVMSVLPDPVGDVVNALRASPEVVKVGVIVWLKKKATNAAIESCDLKEARYMAFHDCLAADACTALDTLKSTNLCRAQLFERSYSFYGVTVESEAIRQRTAREWSNGILLIQKKENWGGDYSIFSMSRDPVIECKISNKTDLFCKASGHPCRCQ